MINLNQKLEEELDKKGYSFIKKDNTYYILVEDGELIYCSDFYSKEQSDEYFQFFISNENNLDVNSDWRQYEKEKLSTVRFKNIKWNHDQVYMYDKQVFLPRYSAWYGDDNKSYTYTGLKLTPNKWNPELSSIKQDIEKVAGDTFNSVLMNWYRDGQDSISWHKDTEYSLGRNPVIGSVNLGATRRFLLRRIDDHKKKLEIPLGHGTLLLMRGALQHHWQHSVPKQAKVKENRINLTFRTIKN